MNKKKRAAKWTAAVLGLCLCLAGCGSSDGLSGNGKTQPQTQSDTVQSFKSASVNGIDSGEVQEEYDADAKESSEEDVSAENSLEEENAQIGNEAKKVTKEMLVYRGNVTIDTLDFDKSVADWKQLIDSAGGFVESERVEDSQGLDNQYRIEDEETRKTYYATVRVPSSSFDRIMGETGNLGDVRAKSSNAQNVTQQYGTCQAQLAVYQKEEQRYLEMLEKASKDTVMLQIQEKLFNLQVTIASLKSQMANLETDVAYSYIDVSLRQVTKYQKKPAKKDTFFQRLINTCRESVQEFLETMENLLFTLIMVWYYIVIIAAAVIFVRRKRKRRKKEKEDHAMEQEPEK